MRLADLSTILLLTLPIAGGQSPEPDVVGLVELRERCSPYLGHELELVIQFDRLGEAQNPWLSRFSSAEYLGIHAWGDGQFMWDPADYHNSAPYLFARRGSAEAMVLAQATQYERFLIRGRIGAVLLNEPWIEILRIEKLPYQVGAGTVLHASRGRDLLGQGKRQLAAGEFRRALLADMPEHARADLRRLLSECQRPQ